ncbi:aminopeptidase [bacterium]|nr:aminopeptidase [bacterium]
MIDPRAKKLADVLVNYSTRVRPGDWVIIQGDLLTAPMIEEIYRMVLRAGGHPNTMFGSAAQAEIFYKEASDDQLQWLSPIQRMVYGEADVLISLMGTSNTRNLSHVDPGRISLAQGARREIMQAYMERSASGELRWVGSMYPNNANAQEADMSLSDYEDFVYSATFADRDDPVAEWRKIHEEQEKVVNWLRGRKTLTAKGPNLDLEMSVEGRLFVNSDGRYNMPDGEVFTGPVENSVNGWIEFTYPAIYLGREIEDVRLVFKDGKVVEASATKNEETLLSQLDIDEGARYVGEFAIGTNYGVQTFTKNMLFDEKMGGTVHLALGASIGETLGQNQSAIHWDMLCDMKEDSEIRADGDLLYKDGKFVI